MREQGYKMPVCGQAARTVSGPTYTQAVSMHTHTNTKSVFFSHLLSQTQNKHTLFSNFVSKDKIKTGHKM